MRSDVSYCCCCCAFVVVVQRYEDALASRCALKVLFIIIIIYDICNIATLNIY